MFCFFCFFQFKILKKEQDKGKQRNKQPIREKAFKREIEKKKKKHPSRKRETGRQNIYKSKQKLKSFLIGCLFLLSSSFFLSFFNFKFKKKKNVMIHFFIKYFSVNKLQRIHPEKQNGHKNRVQLNFIFM